MTLGETLSTARMASGYTQRAAAEAAGLHFTHLSKVEHGRDRPSADALRRLAALYGIDPEPLLLTAALARLATALPPGWRLCGPDDVTVTVERLAEALHEAGIRCWKAESGEPVPHDDIHADDARAILTALSADKERQS